MQHLALKLIYHGTREEGVKLCPAILVVIHTYDNTSGVSHFVVIRVSVELGRAIYSNRAHVKGFMYLSPVNRQYFLEM